MSFVDDRGNNYGGAKTRRPHYLMIVIAYVHCDVNVNELMIISSPTPLTGG